jgi:hypothetical protein
VAKTRRAPEDEVRSRRPDDDPDDDAPRQARRRDDDSDLDDEDKPFAPRKKRKSAAGPVRLVLRICGGVAIAVCIIILLIWIYSPVGTDHSMLCYLPPETKSIQGYDVEEGLKNHKIKEVHDTILNNYRTNSGRKFSEFSGVSEKDVVKYLSGDASTDDDKGLDPQERRGSVTVIKFKRAVDQQKFVESFNGVFRVEEKTSKDGKKYHHLYRTTWVRDHEERQDDISFFFPTSRILVYTTTWRECEEALSRQPGRVALQGDIRELADSVDGCYFQADTGWWEAPNGVITNTMAFTLGFVDAEVRDQKTFAGRTGTACWFADNGNHFLFASAALYTDVKTAKSVRRKLTASFEKAYEDIYRSEGGKPGGLDDPFNPKQPNQQGGGFGAGGGFGGGTSSEQSKDILEALTEYAETAHVYPRGRLVIIEGRIPHGPPETGTFEKFWKAVGQRYNSSNLGFPGGGFGGPMGGPPGMMGPGMMGPRPGMPGGPGGPPGPRQ